jgi:hypothetical protein
VIQHPQNILESTATISVVDAHELFLQALLGSKIEFAKLLLENSYVNIENFMTNGRLKDLYIEGLKQDFMIPGGKSFFYQIVSKKLSVINDDETNFENWKSHLVPDFPTANKFHSHSPDILPLFEKIAYCERKLIDNDWNSIYSRKGAYYSDLDRPCLYPLRDLFLWCLLFRRVEMARVLWSQSNDGLVYALAD